MSTSQTKKVLEIAMKVRDQMSPAIKTARAMVRKLGRAFKITMGIAKKAVRGVGAAIKTLLGPIGLVTAALGGFGITKLISAAADAQRAVREIGTLLGDVGESTLAKLSADIRKVAIEGGQSFEAAFKGAYDAISAGVPARRLLKFLGTANKLAVGGAADVAETVDLLTSTVNAFGDSFENVDRHADAMFTTVRLGKTTITELAGSVGRVAPNARAAGLTIEELGGSIATLTAAGLSTEESATRLNAALVQMIKLTDQQRAKLRSMGVDFSVAGIKANGFTKTMVDLAVVTGGDIEKVAEIASNVRAMGGILVLGAEGGKKLTESMEGMGEAAGATERAYEKMSGTFSQAFNRMKAAIADVAVEVGDAFIPILTDAASATREWLAQNRESFRKWAVRARISIVFVAKMLGEFKSLLKDSLTDDTLADSVGQLVGIAGKLALGILRETVVAGTRLVFNAVQGMTRPMVESVRILGGEVGKSLLDALMKPFERSLEDELAQKMEAIAKMESRLEVNPDSRVFRERRDRFAREAEEIRRLIIEQEDQAEESILAIQDLMAKSMGKAIVGLETDFKDGGEAITNFKRGVATEMAVAASAIRNVVLASGDLKVVWEQFGPIMIPMLGGIDVRLARLLALVDEFPAAWDAAGQSIKEAAGELPAMKDGIEAAKDSAEDLVDTIRSFGSFSDLIFSVDEVQRIRRAQLDLMSGMDKQHAQAMLQHDEQKRALLDLWTTGQVGLLAYSQLLDIELQRHEQSLEDLKAKAEAATATMMANSARLVRDSEIALLGGITQRKAAMIAGFDDELVAHQKMVADKKITEEAFKVWQENREALHLQQMQVFNGDLWEGMSAGASGAMANLKTEFEIGQEFMASFSEAGQRGAGRLFAGFITGADDMRDRMKSVTEEMLQMIGKLITKMLLLKLFGGQTGGGTQGGFGIGSLLGGGGGGGFGGFERGGVVPGGSVPVLEFARGGVTPGSGGIVRRDTLFRAGENSKPEAIVPLPDGRKIPVDLRGASGGGVVNAPTINIAITSPDTGGVQRMLVDNQETIEGMIMRAMQQRSDMREVVRSVK